uniref:Ig-like domain-containing protein n=1 Tax=Salarias fasciatus TaxID=181472 RepID=A0A672FFN3_SALFA
MYVRNSLECKSIHPKVCVKGIPYKAAPSACLLRLFSDQSVENLATFSPRFGRQVNEPYGGKVFFTEAALNSTAITVRDVTWQDESCYVCSFNVFPDGSRGRQTCLTVQGTPPLLPRPLRPTVTAAVGGDALFCCQLLQPKDVWQVTWQKLSSTGDGREGSWRDLASFNRYFGQWVNAKFSGKVAFRDASLQNCSIVLRRVQVEDEGCYRCLFNIDPEGVFTGRTCLQLHGEAEPRPLHPAPVLRPTARRIHKGTAHLQKKRSPSLGKEGCHTCFFSHVAVRLFSMNDGMSSFLFLFFRTNQTPLRQPDRDSLKQRTPSFKTTVSRVSRVSRELFSQKENFGFFGPIPILPLTPTPQPFLYDMRVHEA